jgi:penicillin-binding protein 1A
MSEIPVQGDPIGDTGRDRSGDAPQQPRTRTAAAAGEFWRALRADFGAWASRAKRFRWRPERSSPVIAPAPAPAARRSTTLRVFRGFMKGSLALAVIAAVGLGVAMFWALHDLPLEAAEAEVAEPTILLEAADGEPIGRVGQFKIADAARADFSDHLVNAVLSIEDRRFYAHFGVDPRGIARAFRRNMEAGEVVEGGSTITQQLVKMLVLDNEQTFTRKFREAVTAVWLETRLSKDEILTRYLNLVYMGASAHGMPAAARIYFDKDVSELTLAEAAMLAGVIRAPSDYNPLRDMEVARGRAELVLDAMVESGAIDAEAAEQARAEPAILKHPEMAAESGTWFADWAADEAAAVAGSFRGTLRVRTTLDPAIQRLAEQAVNQGLAEVGVPKGISQAALVAMRPDGSVVAMVGGRDYEESQFNRAVQAQRQPGSAFKLFVYFAALRKGFDLDDVIEDAPVEVDGWKPENFGGEEYGRVTLAEAFAKSINRVAARLALEVGIPEVMAAARDLGLDAPLGEHPSLALGTEEVTLLDLTGAYASVAAGSAPVQPWGISAFGTDEQEKLYSMGPPAEPRQSLEPYWSRLVTLLQMTVEQGTGRHAAIEGGFAAGKTGTSQNHRDAWFIGFNEALIVGVWVGNDDGTPMDEVTGGSLPATIWKNFVTQATPLVGQDAIASAPSDGLGGAMLSAAEPGLCNVSACAAEYRSFRPSDCTYQPYDGPRRLCDIPPEGGVTPVAGWQQLAPGVMVPQQLPGHEPLLGRSPILNGQQPLREQPMAASAEQGGYGLCDLSACEAEYSSFRASDCTYQPYGGGPRQSCDKGSGATQTLADTSAEVMPEAMTSEVIPEALPEQPGQASCDVNACAAEYNSFRASDCTFQPLGGGPRQICTKAGGGEPLSLGEAIPIEAAPAEAAPGQEPVALIYHGLPGQAAPSACDVAACAAEYSSFDPASCTFQPLEGGPRQICMR